MKVWFEFQLDVSDENAQRMREHVVDSCFWQRTIKQLFEHRFNMIVNGVEQFQTMRLNEENECDHKGFAHLIYASSNEVVCLNCKTHYQKEQFA